VSDAPPPPSEPPSGGQPPPPPPPPPPSPPPGGYSTPPPPGGYSAPPPPPAGGYSQPPPGQWTPAPSPTGPAAWQGPPLAEWPKRVAAFLIDNVAAGLVVFVLVLILGAISDVLGLLIALVGYLGAFGFALYNAYLGGETGQSIGKQQLGLRVVRETDLQNIGGALGIGRYFLHILDGIPCYVGYLWPLWDPKKQTFADKIVRTVVLDTGAR
jgi:uncharacterized RDD family membrane protein YckC